ncbi:VOC family protein [Telmatospirillum sp.]|uniref:VOC family protein n=1 Tax=Telmatospirillum sp. TaxID=2079197 RepID=UPI00283CF6DA|nr:VOC family protein [Telmatospirillum sp.]MDR3435171.1 VOC family protein [Telmatospirillum sp.]
MRLNQVTVPVTDVPRAISFYLRLGLTQIVGSPHYARFLCPDGGSTFSVEKAEAVIPGIVVYFECADLDHDVKIFKSRGIVFDSDPALQQWAWREARLRDPDGNRICLFSAGENRISPSWALNPPRVYSADGDDAPAEKT